MTTFNHGLKTMTLGMVVGMKCTSVKHQCYNCIDWNNIETQDVVYGCVVVVLLEIASFVRSASSL